MISEIAGPEETKNQRKNSPPDSNPSIDADHGKNLSSLSSCKPKCRSTEAGSFASANRCVNCERETDSLKNSPWRRRIRELAAATVPRIRISLLAKFAARERQRGGPLHRRRHYEDPQFPG